MIPTELTDAELDFICGGQNNAGGNGINIIVQDVIDVGDVDVRDNVRDNQVSIAVLSAVRQRQGA
jgi:hypothetical protein